MEEIERSAASVEEAIELALGELGVTEQEARITVVQEPRGGVFGLGAQPAVVRVRALEAAAAAGSGDPLVDEQAEIAADFLDGLLAAMGLEADVEINDVEGGTYVDLWGAEGSEDMGILIGKHGHTVDSLQEIVRSVVQARTGERCQILVDVEDYRKRRLSRVRHIARDAGRRVKRTGKEEALEPMTAYERKVVHDAVSELGGLETASEGEEPGRRVVIRRTLSE